MQDADKSYACFSSVGLGREAHAFAIPEVT